MLDPAGTVDVQVTPTGQWNPEGVKSYKASKPEQSKILSLPS
jgi:hypothetical protein